MITALPSQRRTRHSQALSLTPQLHGDDTHHSSPSPTCAEFKPASSASSRLWTEYHARNEHDATAVVLTPLCDQPISRRTPNHESGSQAQVAAGKTSARRFLSAVEYLAVCYPRIAASQWQGQWLPQLVVPQLQSATRAPLQHLDRKQGTAPRRMLQAFLMAQHCDVAAVVKQRAGARLQALQCWLPARYQLWVRPPASHLSSLIPQDTPTSIHSSPC